MWRPRKVDSPPPAADRSYPLHHTYHCVRGDSWLHRPEVPPSGLLYLSKQSLVRVAYCFTDDQVERDDFDTEARAEAQRYSKIRHDEMNRERIKTENKKRKSRGQELLPLPKKVKNRDDSSDDALDVSHRRDKQGDDFQYKGRE
jgi:hypothetical protein